jgi:hypothetical protein
MANVYKTAKGKAIDIDKVKLANESAVAVGNMKVNARGDLIGPGGQIIASRNQIMDQVYAVPSTGGYSPNDPETFNQHRQSIEANNAKQLNNLVNATVAPATTTTPAPAARGSLADSVAKQTTVVEEEKKSTGPSRI